MSILCDIFQILVIKIDGNGDILRALWWLLCDPCVFVFACDFRRSACKSSDISTLENEPEEEEEEEFLAPPPHHGLLSGKIKKKRRGARAGGRKRRGKTVSECGSGDDKKRRRGIMSV